MSLCDFPYVLKIRDNTLDKEDAGTASELWSHYRGWYCAPNRTSAIQTMKMIVVTYFYCYLIVVIYYLFIYREWYCATNRTYDYSDKEDDCGNVGLKHKIAFKAILIE